jgi:uncharacterized membrane protein
MASGLIKVIEEQGALEQISNTIQPAINGIFESAGSVGQGIKNVLQGSWLGHPLHPALTDIPLGAWTTALVLDVQEEITGRKDVGKGADAAIAVGLAGAVGAAVTGLTDWSSINRNGSRKLGLVHGMLNATATVIYSTSLVMRRQNSRRLGRRLAFLGYAISGLSAYLGGHLVFEEQTGVKRTRLEEEPYTARY